MIIGVASGALRWFIGSQHAVELTLAVGAVAIGYVVWRFLRQRPAASGVSDSRRNR